MFSRNPASDSSKLHQFVSFDVWVMFLFVFNTFAAKRDCSRIYRSLPNATTVEILSTVDSCLFLTTIGDANISSLFKNVEGT